MTKLSVASNVRIMLKKKLSPVVRLTYGILLLRQEREFELIKERELVRNNAKPKEICSAFCRNYKD